MNKEELIVEVADRAKCTKKDAEGYLTAVIDSIKQGLIDGEKIQLIGFGTFEVKERAERIGRNPQKPGELIKIPASKAPVFKAGKALKDAINK